MELLKRKVIFITGATSGIGKSCAYAFAKEGTRLILTARRKNILDEIAGDLNKKYNSEVYTAKLDVRNYSEVKNLIDSLPVDWKLIDILINNAGLGRGLNKLYEGNPEGWDEMIDTNIKGLLYVTKEIVQGMVKRQSGHVINIGSIAGYQAYKKGGVYCATKHGVKAITDSLRMDVIDKNIRVSSVDPGAVNTNFSNVRFYGDKEKAKNTYRGMTPLTGDDVAEAVIFVATRPAHVNINEMIIMPSVQANVFVIHRRED